MHPQDLQHLLRSRRPVITLPPFAPLPPGLNLHLRFRYLNQCSCLDNGLQRTYHSWTPYWFAQGMLPRKPGRLSHKASVDSFARVWSPPSYRGLLWHHPGRTLSRLVRAGKRCTASGLLPSMTSLSLPSPVGSHPVVAPAEAPFARPAPVGSYPVVAPTEAPLTRSSPVGSHPAVTPAEASFARSAHSTRRRVFLDNSPVLYTRPKTDIPPAHQGGS